MAQSLSTDETGIIGVVVPKIAHTFFSNVLQGVNKVAEERGYEIVLCITQESEQREIDHLKTLMSLQVDGILISVSEETTVNESFRRVAETRTPLVFVDRTLEKFPSSSVVVDDVSGAHRAVEHAIESGYRTIAHIAGRPGVDIGRKRQMGYEAALRDHGRPVDGELVVEAGFDEVAGYDGMNRLLEAGTRPDAVFAVTVPVALGAEDAIRESDAVAAEEIQIYSFGQHDMSRFFTNPHISVHQPAEEMGRRALDLLLEEIANPEQDPQTVTLPNRLVEPSEIRPSYL
jgi:LacI family transcriptional regulator